jgi:hypothetical protein
LYGAAATGRIVAVDMEFTIYAHETTHTLQARSPAEYVRLLREGFGLEVDSALITSRWGTATIRR